MPEQYDISASPMLQAALAYASRGYHVFPAEPRGKRPLMMVQGGRWAAWATTEPLTVVEWWTEHPEANIIVVCGARSDLTVLDFDVKGGRGGEQLALEVLGEGWKDRHRYQSTPSRGYHVWLPYMEAWGNPKGVGGSLDIQGEGSYVVVAPSRTDEGPYLEVNQHLGDARGRSAPSTVTLPEGAINRPQRGARGAGADGEPVPDWASASVPEGVTERLPAKLQAALVRGDWSAWGGDRSAGVLGACAALWGQGLDAAQVLRLLLLCPATATVGTDRRGSIEGAAEWLWRYAVLPARPPSPGEVFGLDGVADGGEVAGDEAAEPSLLDAALARVRALRRPVDFAEVESFLRTVAESELLPLHTDYLLEVLRDELGLSVRSTRATLAGMRRGIAEERRVAARSRVAGPVHEYVYVEQTGAFWCLVEPGWYSRTAFKDMYGLDEEAYRTTLARMPRVRKVTYRPYNPWAADYDPLEALWCLNEGTVRQELNTWQPPSAHPQLGATEDDVAPWLQMAREVLRVPEPELQYALQWMAYSLQHPERKVNHMLLLGGDQGIGKDSFILPLLAGCGSNALQVKGLQAGSDFDHPSLGHSHLLVLQELRLGGRFQDASEAYDGMKNKLASPPRTLTVNIKHVKQYDIPNLVNVLAMTNHQDALRLEQDDRRAYMVWCEGRAGRVPGGSPDRYWTEFHEWLDAGGTEAVLGWLLGLDTSGFRPGATPPVTRWKEHARGDALPPVASAVATALDGPFWGRELVGMWELRDAVQVALMGTHKVTEYSIRDAMHRLRYRARRMSDPGSGGRARTTVYVISNEEHWMKAEAGSVVAWIELERNGILAEE